MKAKFLDLIVITEYQFEIEIETIKYSAKLWLNQKGKIIDDQISYFDDGELLSGEGNEGEIRKRIIDYLDKNWDSLIK